jgi:hypothetical protein
MQRQLIEVDWFGELTVNDAIQSYLVDHPDSYYIPANRRWVMYLTREHGLIQMFDDFSMMDDVEVSEYITAVLEMLYK